MLRAVLFDVDFTLVAARAGARARGVPGGRRSSTASTLDPARYEDARLPALDDLQRHPELVHDEEIWIAFTEDIVRGMGGDASGAACVRGRAWCGDGSDHENFSSTTTRCPCSPTLRRHGARDRARLERAARPGGVRRPSRARRRRLRGLEGARARRSRTRRSSRPRSARLGVEPAEAAMVGDSDEDDIEGARALGMTRDPARPRRPAPGGAGPHRRTAALPAALGFRRTDSGEAVLCGWHAAGRALAALSAGPASRRHASVWAPSGASSPCAGGDAEVRSRLRRVATGPTQTSSPSQRLEPLGQRPACAKTAASSAASASCVVVVLAGGELGPPDELAQPDEELRLERGDRQPASVGRLVDPVARQRRR